MAAFGDWLTVKEAAELTGYNPEQIRRLARDGKIERQKFGYVWMIGKTSLLEYIETEGRGPKNKPKPLDKV